MDKKVNLPQLSPLDQIRQMEAEITRSIAAAHEAAGDEVARARVDASSVRKQALEEGGCEGQARYREILLKAEEEAKGLVVGAQALVDSLRKKGETTMESAVCSAVELVIGEDGDGLSK